MKQIYKKENRILLSMITGMIVISLLCGIQWNMILIIRERAKCLM